MSKQRIALTLTAEAISFLDAEAKRKGVSKSVVVELLIRDRIKQKEEPQNMRGLPGELE